MRHGSTGRRQRSRGNGGRSRGPQKMQVFDSNGPDVRIRGTAHQVTEKYLALAKDASSAGDIVLAESYMQHAEHYQRVINEFTKDVQEPAYSDDRSSNNSGNRQESGRESKTSDEDLSLPASILGETSKAASVQESGARTAEEVSAS